MNETAIDRVTGDDFCSVYTDEKKYIRQLKKFAEDYPKDVEIIKENFDGSVLAHVPYEWFRFIKPPTKRNLTEEQRRNVAERMKKARAQKAENNG